MNPFKPVLLVYQDGTHLRIPAHTRRPAFTNRKRTRQGTRRYCPKPNCGQMMKKKETTELHRIKLFTCPKGHEQYSAEGA